MTTGQLRRYDPATQAELLPHAGTIDRLGVVEDASGGSLPTSMSLALAETGLDEGDVRKASILIARELDLDHNWVLPTYYVRRIGEAFTTDPISGNVISLETARRLAKPYNAEVLSSILGSALERPSTTGASPGELGGQAAVAAANKTFLDRTAKLIQSFAPLDGDAVSWSDAIGAALYLARDGTNLQAFDANLRITADVQGMSELEKIGVAHAAAQAKVSLHNRFDVVQFAATSPEERALWQRAEQAGGLSPALRARFTETNQALRPGENAQVLRGSVFALADDIKANTGNYVAEGKAVVAKQRLEEVAFGHSMLGKVMGGVGYSMDRLVGSVGAGFRLAIGSPQQGVPLGHLITGDVAGVKEAWHDAQDAFWGRSNYFQDLAVDSFHLPRWTGSLIELGALWYLSPDVLAGRLISASRYAKLLTEPERVAKFLDSPLARVGRLRDVTPSDLLIREALRATDAEKFFARATDDFRAYFSEAGINDELSRAIFDYSRFGQKAGFTVRQMKADVDELWWTAFGKRPNPGSFADSFSRGMRVREERVARDLPDLLSRREAYTPGTLEFSQRAAANDALGVLEEFANTYGWQTVRHAPGGVPPEVLDAFGFGGLAPELGVPSGIVLQKEIPHIGFAIRPFALRRMGLADTEGGRLLRSLFRGSPEVRSGQLIINREERAVGGFEEALIRGKMPEQDIAAAKLDMARAVSKTNPYAEEHFVATVNKWNKRVLDHIASDYGLSSDQMERILRDMGRRLGWTAKEEAQTFGTLAEARAAGLAPVKKLIEEPFLISQKLNRWPMTDPAAVRRAVAEAMGTSRKFRAAMLRTLGATVPEAQFVRIPLRKAFDRVFDVVMKDIFLSVWKPLVVLRPAYVLRVVGLEEQARFLATAKGIGARLESSKLGSRLLSDLDTVLGKEVKSIPIEALVGSGDKQVVEHLKFGRPGLLPKEALANNTAGLAIPGAETWWERHYLDELSVDNWGAVTDKSPHFYDVWAHALVNQFGKDTLGAMYLRDIRQVLGEEQSIERAMAFLRSPDGRMTAERLMGPGGFTEEALRDQVTIGVKVARAYAPHPELAAAALDGTLTPKLLQSTFDDVRPLYVHGPQLELALAQKGPIKTATGRLYNVILRTPTNVLSRQPYFKHWYSKMLEGLVQEAVDAGGTITPAALKAFQATSREFALSQVKRIMFDFTRQARLGELLGWAVPFFQPFSEAFVVWGRILRQNPAVGALALHLFEAGKKSGFLRTDPDTGETVVPLSEWLGAVPIGVALGVLPTDKGKFHSGWGLSAPLSSFNFFFNSAFPIPFGNTNISVPTPGLSPGAQFILQKLLSPSGPLGSRIPPGVRQRFASWLFQYGGVTPENMIPAWMRYTLQGLVGPKWFSKEIDLQATEFLRLRQYLGQDEHDPVPGYDQAQWDALSPDQRKRRLQDWARKQARSLAFFRAFFGANSFAMPKVTFPTDQIEREYQDLTAKLGPEDATKRFLADHPDLSLLTVAKTIWAKDNESPISVPASKWVQEILTSPGGREFASEHPQWVFAIIPHELRGPDAKFDPGAFFEQVSSGVRDVLTPYQFLTKDEERKFWDGWFAEQEAWTAQQDALRSEGLSSSSDTWQKAKLAHDARVDHLRQFYPAGSAKLDRLDLGGVDPRVLSEARRLSTDSTFLQTDVGKGLAEYLALRDGIEVQMSEAGIHTLRTKAAEKMGLPERYDTTVADIEARYPDFKLAYQAFFDHDLQGVETAGDKLLSGLPPAAAEAIKAWEVQNSARQDAPAQATNDIEKNQAYTAIRQWVEQAYEQFPHDQNPAVINWATRGPDEKLNYELGLMDRPYIFMSRFDRQEILGEPSSTAAEQAWTAVDNARIEVQKFLAANPTASAGPVYNQLDAYVQQLAASNPDFAAQLGAANQWGHVQEKLLPQIFGQASQAASWWSAFFDALRTVQAVVERNDLHSDKDAGYAGLRDQLAAYVDQLKQTNPVFSHQWDYLEEQTPNPLMASFMPDTWYRLGG